MKEEIRCFGCGAIIQNKDINKIGYVPKLNNNKQHILCQRCFKLQHYHQLQQTNLTADDYLNILQEISKKDALIIYIVDLFDFNGSMIQGIQRHLMGKDLIIVGNKRDLLPKSCNETKITHWIYRQLKEYGIKPLNVLITSAKKNYHLDSLMDLIDTHRKNRDVYVVGTTNVGKSTLINAFLKAYASEIDLPLITTSEFPGTTLDLIEIPLDENHALYDSPGIMNHHQITHMLNPKDLKIVIPSVEVKQQIYQLNAKQTLYVGGLARLDFIEGEKTSFAGFFSNNLKIHRCKLENADKNYINDQITTPKANNAKKLENLKKHDFFIPEGKHDIVISGLGWFSLKGTRQHIRVFAPDGVGVFIRQSLI